MEYVFTDIAASFLPAARQRFSAVRNMQFRVLDINETSMSQGFEPGSYDVIVAANVIHATKELDTTIRNIASLLSPSGSLVVLEGTRPVRGLDLTFGLTDGWWRFSDQGLRPDYPLLSSTAGEQLLSRAGFATSRIVRPLEVNAGEREPENSVILAHYDASLAAPSTSPQDSDDTRSWLIFTDATGVGAELAADFQAKGSPCQLIQTPAELSDLRVSSGLPSDVVFLGSLDDVNDNQTPAEHALRLNTAILDTVQKLAHWRSQHKAATDGVPEPLRFWIVTRGAQGASGGTPASIAQASLWGFGRTLALEHQDWQSHLVDLDPKVEILKQPTR